MNNIIPYIKKKEESKKDTRIPLYIEVGNNVEKENNSSIKKEKNINNNKSIDFNVNFVVDNFIIKF
jgi:hypothetical protein